MSIPENIKQEWENSVNEFINSGVFERRYATKEAIKQTKSSRKNEKSCIESIFYNGAKNAE
jgi:hypothetical protein